MIPEITIQQWFGDESNLKHLDTILRDPIFRRACELVEAKHSPGVSALAVAPEHHPIVHSFQSGIHSFRRELKQMTSQPTNNEALPPEWEGDHVNLTTEDHAS